MRQKFLLLASFLIGFAVVGMEITSSRLLAPHFGTSIFVWSNIISVVLLCLAVGYFLGGRLADRRPDFKMLVDLCLGGGLWFFVIPKLTPAIVAWAERLIYAPHPSNAGFFVSSFAVSLVLFGAPLVLLGMTSPLLVKIYSLSDHRVGNSAGLVYAVSTAGSILGSIVPTFWGLPLLGTAKTIIALAILLLLLVLFDLTRRRLVWLTLGLVVVCVIYLIPAAKIEAQPAKLLYEGESYYHHIRVFEQAKTRYLVFNEGLTIESVYDRQNVLTGAFYDYYNLLPAQIGNTKPKVLVLGLAGATIPRQYNRFFPDAEVDAIEIDPQVIQVARDYFDLNQVKANIINADGRAYLRDTAKSYDIVIIDVFQNELYIPWTFTTEEFWRLALQKLSPSGVVAMNVHSVSPDAELLGAMSNTLAKVFPHVYLTSLSNQRGYSYMLSASPQPIDARPEAVSATADLKALAETFSRNLKSIAYDPTKPVLTDDWAPVDSMLDHSVEYYRKQRSINR